VSEAAFRRSVKS